MLKSIRISLLAFAFILIFSCKKEKVVKIDDNFFEESEQISVLNAEVSAAGYEFLEIQWKAVNTTHFKAINYSVYLDDQKIVSGLTSTKYSFINLNWGRTYAIKVVATTTDGKEVQQTLQATTLFSPDGTVPAIVRKEYDFNQYSNRLGPANYKKLPDGENLMISYLQHQNSLDSFDSKIIVFKIDKYGHMLWYRLLQAPSNYATDNPIYSTLNNNDQEVLIFSENLASKVATKTGDLILTKDLTNDLNGQSFQSIYRASSQQVIGTVGNGTLISINSQTLNVDWKKTNPNLTGDMYALNMDSKKNIYYVFEKRYDPQYKIRIHKCSATGEFLKEFEFDSELPGSSYNYGFSTNSLLFDEQDNLYLFGNNYSNYQLRYFKLDADGVLIKKDTPSEILAPRQVFFNEKGETVVIGRNNGNYFLTLYIFDKNMNLKSKRNYENIPNYGFLGLNSNQDGSYNLFFSYQRNPYANTPEFAFIKTDVNGNM